MLSRIIVWLQVLSLAETVIHIFITIVVINITGKIGTILVRDIESFCLYLFIPVLSEALFVLFKASSPFLTTALLSKYYSCHLILEEIEFKLLIQGLQMIKWQIQDSIRSFFDFEKQNSIIITVSPIFLYCFSLRINGWGGFPCQCHLLRSKRKKCPLSFFAIILHLWNIHKFFRSMAV